jgi:hypothetical protein
MVRVIVLFSFLWVVSSCATTKFYKKQYCKVCLQGNDWVLFQNNIPDLSHWEEERIFLTIQKEFLRSPKAVLGSFEDWDYELLAKNIQPHELSRLDSELGIKYLLQLTLKRSRGSEVMDYSMPNEVNSLYPTPRLPLESSSVVVYRLVETATGETVFSLELSTFSQEVSIPSKDGGMHHVDTGNVFSTIHKSVKRGTKYLLADCICPKGKYVKWSKVLEKL